MKTPKARDRHTLSQLLYIEQNALSTMRFYFNHRHTFEDGNGYAYCHKRFYKARNTLKWSRSRIARTARRYVLKYANKIDLEKTVR